MQESSDFRFFFFFLFDRTCTISKIHAEMWGMCWTSQNRGPAKDPEYVTGTVTAAINCFREIIERFTTLLWSQFNQSKLLRLVVTLVINCIAVIMTTIISFSVALKQVHFTVLPQKKKQFLAGNRWKKTDQIQLQFLLDIKKKKRQTTSLSCARFIGSFKNVSLCIFNKIPVNMENTTPQKLQLDLAKAQLKVPSSSICLNFHWNWIDFSLWQDPPLYKTAWMQVFWLLCHLVRGF